jgi:glycosyltransferase involved in cell wall biosynthesis
MAVWNEEQYLNETLPAVLSQTMPDFRLLILDNGSTDGSYAILRRFADADDRITLERSPVNLIPAIAANYGWGFCMKTWPACRWFMGAGSDDMMEPDYLEAILAAADAHPEANCIYSPVRFIGHPGRGTWVYPPYAPKRIHQQHQIPGWRALTRELWAEVGEENTECGIGADWEWIVRASVKGVLRPHQLDRPYLNVRVRERGRVSQSDQGDRPALLRHFSTLVGR